MLTRLRGDVKDDGLMKWLTGGGKPKYVDDYLLECNLVYYESHMNCPGMNPGLRNEKPVSKCLRQWHIRFRRYLS